MLRLTRFVVMVGLLASATASQAQITPVDAERFTKQLSFDNVKGFHDARLTLKARASTAAGLMDYLQDRGLKAQVAREMERVIPDVHEALSKTPGRCALVSIVVDSGSNQTATHYLLRYVRFEGVGDTAVQVLARNVLANEKEWTVQPRPPKGYGYDDDKSHVLCFGMVDGQLRAAPVFMPLLRSGVMNAVDDLRKAEVAKKAADARKAAAAEAALRNAEQARKTAEAARANLENARRTAEAARKADEARRAAEAARKADEARRAAEAARKADEARRAAEAARKADEARRAAEAARRAEEARRASRNQPPIIIPRPR